MNDPGHTRLSALIKQARLTASTEQLSHGMSRVRGKMAGAALAGVAERITISLGVVQLGVGVGVGETATAFFERADRALCPSKRDRRNRATALDAAAELHP